MDTELTFAAALLQFRQAAKPLSIDVTAELIERAFAADTKPERTNASEKTTKQAP